MLTKSSYESLKTTVLQLLQEGRRRAARAVEREKVQTYWAVGREIHEHLLAHQERANYGEFVITTLAEDTGLARQRLYEALKFFRQFPIVRAPGQLGWGHFLEVLSLPSPEARDFYLREAAEHEWTTRELKAQIQASAFKAPGDDEILSAPAPNTPHPPIPVRGRLHTYRVKKVGEDIAVLDLGFATGWPVPLAEIGGLGPVTPDALVTSVRDATKPSGFRFETVQVDPAMRYTYRAHIDRVVDADTLRAEVHIGFKPLAYPIVRLRGINAPEAGTTDGDRATDFVRQTLSGVDFVVLRTFWRGRFGRYLADVFYLPGEDDPEAVVSRGRYLNAEMVEEGMAAPVVA